MPSSDSLQTAVAAASLYLAAYSQPVAGLLQWRRWERPEWHPTESITFVRHVNIPGPTPTKNQQRRARTESGPA